MHYGYYSIIINATNKKYCLGGKKRLLLVRIVFIIGDQGLKPNVARLHHLLIFQM